MLLDRLAELTDADARRPSRLPGWSVGHVLSHLARNAESFDRLISGAREGRALPQYPGGAAQRNGDIESGSGRSARELVTDVRRTIDTLDAHWSEIDDDVWQREVEMFTGRAVVADLPFRRWREVMVHLLDLDLGFTTNDWPEEYVRSDLRMLQMAWASRRPMGMSNLPSAATAVDDRTRLAWLLGRAEIAGLDPAGIMS